MGISETKKQIVIDNYFKNTCDVNTSIKEAFTKGFEVGLTKAFFPEDEYEAKLKVDMVANYKDIQADIRRFMYDVNPGSSESDYACNYMIDIIQQKINELKGNEMGVR